MPAKSKAQQKAAGAALAAKRGDAKKSDLKGASREMYESMSEKQLDEFASTKRKGKAEHVPKDKSCRSSGMMGAPKDRPSKTLLLLQRGSESRTKRALASSAVTVSAAFAPLALRREVLARISRTTV